MIDVSLSGAVILAKLSFLSLFGLVAPLSMDQAHRGMNLAHIVPDEINIFSFDYILNTIYFLMRGERHRPAAYQKRWVGPGLRRNHS